MPSRYFKGTGTPITGSGVMAATMPGRCAAPPPTAMMARKLRVCALLACYVHALGRSMGRK